MTGEINPVGGETVRPGGMQVQNAQRHWQALLTIDHTHQIGILDIVIGQHVAVVAMRMKNDTVQGLDQCRPVAGKNIADIGCKLRRMIPVAIESDAGTVKGGKRKRAFGEINIVVGACPDISEDFFCFCARCHDAGITILGDVKGSKAVA